MRNMIPDLIAHINQLLAVLGAMLFAFWQALREKRKRMGLSIEGAAELCEVNPSTYARWERGKQYPHPKNLTMLLEKIDPYDEEWADAMSDVPDAFLPPSYWND